MNKLLLLGFFVFAPLSLASADLKIAVIDLTKAFDSYYKTQDAEARLKEKQEAAQKDMTDLITEYEHMQEEAQKLHDAAEDHTLSDAARQDKEAAFKQKEQDILNLQNKMQETKQERERELQDDAMRQHKEILDEITKVVTDYAGPQGFDLVIDKTGISVNGGSPVIVYSSGKLIDITPEIIRQLNATAPAGAPSGAAAPAPPPAAP